MSERNGDRARFQKIRKRKLHHRQRIRALMNGMLTRTFGGARSRLGVRATLPDPATSEASLAMSDEGGPMRAGD
jgi:hypothetical protein